MAAARSVTCTPSLHDALPICTSLASVVLLMTSLGLGDVEAFPFVEPPASRAITDRSEEHTSELQSRGHLVCRLLRDKTTGNSCLRTAHEIVAQICDVIHTGRQ